MEKCGVDRPRSGNDSEIDNRLQMHRCRLNHWMAAVAAAESAAEIADEGYCGGRTFEEYMEDVRKISGGPSLLFSAESM